MGPPGPWHWGSLAHDVRELVNKPKALLGVLAGLHSRCMWIPRGVPASLRPWRTTNTHFAYRWGKLRPGDGLPAPKAAHSPNPVLSFVDKSRKRVCDGSSPPHPPFLLSMPSSARHVPVSLSSCRSSSGVALPMLAELSERGVQGQGNAHGPRLCWMLPLRNPEPRGSLL